MTVPTKAEMIDYLVRLEFPGSNAPPPVGSEQRDVQAHSQRKEAIAARRAALWQMNEDGLTAMTVKAVSDEQRQDVARRAERTPPATEPDWNFWRHEDEWHIVDAALLIVNIEPRRDLGPRIKDILDAQGQTYVRDDQTRSGLSDDARARFNIVEELIGRAFKARNLHRLRMRDNDVEPRDFVVWARGKGYDVPSALKTMFVEQEKAAPKPAVDLDNPKAWNTYKTVLTLLAKHYGYDPKDMKGPATSKMQRELDKYGLELSEKTIRKLFAIGAGEE